MRNSKINNNYNNLNNNKYNYLMIFYNKMKWN